MQTESPTENQHLKRTPVNRIENLLTKKTILVASLCLGCLIVMALTISKTGTLGSLTESNRIVVIKVSCVSSVAFAAFGILGVKSELEKQNEELKLKEDEIAKQAAEREKLQKEDHAAKEKLRRDQEAKTLWTADLYD